MFLRKTIWAACSLSALLVGTQSPAATIFDSKALAEADGIGSYNGADALFNGGLGALMTAHANTPINQIGLFVSVPTAQNVKFLIFKTGYSELLFSQTKYFAANPTAQYIYSDPFSFTLQKDTSYDIGAIGDGTPLIFRYTLGHGYSQGSLDETWMSHIANFNAPISGSYVDAQPFIQLNTLEMPTTSPAVPEPASWAMMIGGFALAGSALRSRSRLAFA